MPKSDGERITFQVPFSQLPSVKELRDLGYKRVRLPVGTRNNNNWYNFIRCSTSRRIPSDRRGIQNLFRIQKNKAQRQKSACMIIIRFPRFADKMCRNRKSCKKAATIVVLRVPKYKSKFF